MIELEQSARATAAQAFIDHVKRTGLAYVQDAGDGEFIIDGVVNVGAAIQAALSVPSPGVDAVKYNGKIVIAHPDMPPHIWDGEKMTRVEFSHGGIDVVI